MKIIKHRKQEEKKPTRKFTCQKCGCVFECEEDEYWAEPQCEISVSISWSTTKTYKTCCPECHKIVEDYEHNIGSETYASFSDSNNAIKDLSVTLSNTADKTK